MTGGVVVLVGNPRPGSRTSRLAAEFAAALSSELTQRGWAVPRSTALEVSDLVAASFDATAAAPPAPRADAIDLLRAARLLVVAVPSYKGTYPGLLKLFLEQVPHLGLDGVVAVPVAVAASPDHATATAADLARLLRELGADVPRTVAILEARLADPQQVAGDHARAVADVLAVSAPGLPS